MPSLAIGPGSNLCDDHPMIHQDADQIDAPDDAGSSPQTMSTRCLGEEATENGPRYDRGSMIAQDAFPSPAPVSLGKLRT